MNPKSVQSALEMTRLHFDKYPDAHKQGKGFPWMAYLPPAFRNGGTKESVVINIVRVSHRPSLYRISNPVLARNDTKALSYNEAYDRLKPFEWPGASDGKPVTDEEEPHFGTRLLNKFKSFFADYERNTLLVEAARSQGDSSGTTLRFKSDGVTAEARPQGAAAWEIFALGDSRQPEECIGCVKYTLMKGSGAPKIEVFLPDAKAVPVMPYHRNLESGVGDLIRGYSYRQRFRPILEAEGAMQGGMLITSEVVEVPVYQADGISKMADKFHSKLCQEESQGWAAPSDTQRKLKEDLVIWNCVAGYARLSEGICYGHSQYTCYANGQFPRKLLQRFQKHMEAFAESLKGSHYYRDPSGYADETEQIRNEALQMANLVKQLLG